MGKKNRTAITPIRQDDYPMWYQSVVREADMAEMSSVRGCMVIKPWGYGIWERIQRQLDDMIKATGHENAYFPLFIPLSYLEKEAEHVEGFAKECAVITHHRLEEKDGKLMPAGKLEHPLVVRPTSETIIGASFSKWVQSYRDLPLLINQWANVVRWEMRPRIFLRTVEFLWQEGHTVHVDEEDARNETMKMLEVYREFAEDYLALPVVTGEKSPGERFPGAVNTYCIEAMMQDRKALQAGTSHYLGQNFASASDIKFQNKEGQMQHAFTTSWGVSSRLIGGVIMVHGDDDGLRLPPRIAPKQVVIIPVIRNADTEEQVMAYAQEVADSLKGLNYHGHPLVVYLDKRDMKGPDKKWQWVKRGIPIRLEIGPRDMEEGAVYMARRDQGFKEAKSVPKDELAGQIIGILDDMQANYFNQAKAYMNEHMYDHLTTFEDLKAFFTPQNSDKPEIHGGFVRAKCACTPEAEEKLKELKVTIRCIPFEQSNTDGKCIVTGVETTTDVILAKSY